MSSTKFLSTANRANGQTFGSGAWRTLENLWLEGFDLGFWSSALLKLGSVNGDLSRRPKKQCVSGRKSLSEGEMGPMRAATGAEEGRESNL